MLSRRRLCEQGPHPRGTTHRPLAPLADADACTPANVGDAAAALETAAGSCSFSKVSAADGASSPWTQGTACTVTVDAGGSVTYDTDTGPVTCRWNGEDFDVVYGTPGA